LNLLPDAGLSDILTGMSTLGLSGAPESSDGVWKGLFWPTIQNAQDADLAASRGFWICLVIAIVSGGLGSASVSYSLGVSIGSYLDLAVFVFYFLGAAGVRQASVIASAAMFAVYLLGTVFYFWVSPLHFSFWRLIGTALLLTTLRAAILIKKWRAEPGREEDFLYGPGRLNLTWRDRIADQMPPKVWHFGSIVFYVLALILIPLECFGMIALGMHHK
jgi:hypothetical protein